MCFSRTLTLTPNPTPNPIALTLTLTLQSEPLYEYFFGSLCLDNTTALFYMLFLGCSVH